MKIILFSILVGALALPSMSVAADLGADPNYKSKCAGCHGANGEGKTILMIKTAPLNASAGKTGAELTDIISKGIPKTRMKGYGDKLSAEQIQSLVSEIKALK